MLAVEPDSGMNSSTNNNSPVTFKDKPSSLKQHQHLVPTVLDSDNHQNLQQEQTPSPCSDHYIHSRLKSALGSGRKEVYYSGILDGGRVRRVASLNAQAMNQMLCLTESALSVPDSKTDDSSPGMDSTLPSQDVDVVCTPLNGSLLNCNLEALPNRTNTSGESSSSEQAISDTVMSSPLSSPSSSSTTANMFLSPMPTASPKKASVDVVDVMKKRVRRQRNMDVKKTPSTVDSNTGFVKRMASLNAQAFVSVIVGSSRITQAGGEGGKKRLKNSNYNNSKKRKVDQNDVGAEEVSKMGVDSSEDDAAASSTEEHQPMVAQQHHLSPVCAQSSSSRVCSSELASSSNQDELSHDDACCSLESVPCNTLGLLYSGDCISANKSILFTTEEHLPERVIPIIVPTHAFEVNFAMTKALKKSSSAVGKRKSKVRIQLLDDIANKIMVCLLLLSG